MSHADDRRTVFETARDALAILRATQANDGTDVDLIANHPDMAMLCMSLVGMLNGTLEAVANAKGIPIEALFDGLELDLARREHAR